MNGFLVRQSPLDAVNSKRCLGVRWPNFKGPKTYFFFTSSKHCFNNRLWVFVYLPMLPIHQRLSISKKKTTMFVYSTTWAES